MQVQVRRHAGTQARRRTDAQTHRGQGKVRSAPTVAIFIIFIVAVIVVQQHVIASSIIL